MGNVAQAKFKLKSKDLTTEFSFSVQCHAGKSKSEGSTWPLSKEGKGREEGQRQGGCPLHLHDCRGVGTASQPGPFSSPGGAAHSKVLEEEAQWGHPAEVLGGVLWGHLQRSWG